MIELMKVRKFNTRNIWSWLSGYPAGIDATAPKSVDWSPTVNKFVAVGGMGTACSSDGINWTAQYTYGSASVVWVPGLSMFVAVGDNGTSWAMTSTDGINWTTRTTPTFSGGIGPRSIAWSSSLNLLVATATSSSSYAFMTSPDGINWTGRTSTTLTTPTTGWNTVVWSSGLGMFAAFGSASGSAGPIATSTDGITWTSRTNTSTSGINCAVWCPGLSMFMAFGDSGTILTSTNGTTWTLKKSGASSPSYNFYACAWSADLSCVVAIKGSEVVTSFDGTSFSVESYDGFSDFYAGPRALIWSPSLKLFSSSWGTLSRTSGSSFGELDPYGPNVTALVKFEGGVAKNLVDGSTMITNNGSSVVSTNSKFGSYSGNYTGTTPRSNHAFVNKSVFATANSKFTAEVWLYPTNTSLGMGIFGDSGSSSTQGLSITFYNGGGYVALGTGQIGSNFTSGLTANTWQHFAVSRNGSAWRAWLNGTSVWSATDARTSAQIGNNPMIGTDFTYTGKSINAFAGQLDNFRWTAAVNRYDTSSTTITVPSRDFPY